MMIRLLAMLLSVTLLGPPVAVLACEWMCAAKHQASAACHEHGTGSDGVTIVPADLCHELVEAALVQPLRNQHPLAAAAVAAARATLLDSGHTPASPSPTRYVVPPGLAVVPLPLRI